MIMCLWPPLHPLSKLLAIQGHAEEHLVGAEGVEGFLGVADLRGVDTFRCVLDGVFGGSDESFWCNLSP